MSIKPKRYKTARAQPKVRTFAFFAHLSSPAAARHDARRWRCPETPCGSSRMVLTRAWCPRRGGISWWARRGPPGPALRDPFAMSRAKRGGSVVHRLPARRRSTGFATGCVMDWAGCPVSFSPRGVSWAGPTHRLCHGAVRQYTPMHSVVAALALSNLKALPMAGQPAGRLGVTMYSNGPVNSLHVECMNFMT